MAESDAGAGPAVDGASEDVIRATAALSVIALLGCFTKPGFDGADPNDAAVVDGKDTTSLDAGVDGMKYSHNVAFVTSVTTSVTALKSLAAADAFCDMRAMLAGLPENTYVAWLSGPNQAAPLRLKSARGWVRVDGRPFADTIANLTSGVIYHPLRIDETGMDRGGVPVATATTENGELQNADCDSFTGDGLEHIAVGMSDATKRRWTDNATTEPCTESVRLYCLGTDLDTPVTITPVTGLTAFVSTTLFLPEDGPLAADALCETDALSNSFPGNYVALLATPGATAASRLPNVSESWVRRDGIPIALSAAYVINGDLLTTLNVDAGGQYVDAQVWTGITLQGGLDVAAGNTCAGWGSKDMSLTGHVGTSTRTTTNWYRSATAQSCANARRVYCFQE